MPKPLTNRREDKNKIKFKHQQILKLEPMKNIKKRIKKLESRYGWIKNFTAIMQHCNHASDINRKCSAENHLKSMNL